MEGGPPMSELGADIDPTTTVPTGEAPSPADVVANEATVAAEAAKITQAEDELTPEEAAEAREILPQPTDPPEVQKQKAGEVLVGVFGKMFAEHQRMSMTPLGLGQEVAARFLGSLNPSAQKAFMMMAKAMNFARGRSAAANPPTVTPPPTPA